jgi:hypothetical protein
MSIQYTPEELAAIKLNKRNYSTSLGLIYFLKKIARSPFSNPYASVANYTYTLVGESGTTATFNALSSASYAKGAVITLTGTATFKATSGATTVTKPAISLEARIDTPSAQGNQPIVVFANGQEIDSSGNFSFTIPAEITSQLATGSHTIYIDAQSPKGVVKLTGGTDGVRTFTITE